jgi:hypothetical protein
MIEDCGEGTPYVDHSCTLPSTPGHLRICEATALDIKDGFSQFLNTFMMYGAISGAKLSVQKTD